MHSANVASVPQYSPFRYPGGKTWLTPVIRKWLAAYPADTICEPFAGGATASLIAVIEGYCNRAVLIEKDVEVASVWRAILSIESESLIDRILEFKMTRKNVIDVLNGRPRSDVSRAFQTIVKNRCRRGGILAPGAGLLVKGERGRGLTSRWYPETLAMRIRLINSVKEQIEFRHGDGLSALKDVGLTESGAKLFVDPPYPKLMKPGVRPLYNHCDLEHEQLFRILVGSSNDFLLTYDDTDYVRELVNNAGFRCSAIATRNSNSNAKKELLITRPTR